MAERALVAEWHRCRFLWNEAVHQQTKCRKPTFGELSKLLTDARRHNAWLRDGSQVAQQQTLRTYAQTLGRSFEVKGCGSPVFKTRKNSLPSLEYTTRGFTVKAGRLTLPKGVTIPVVWSRNLPRDPTSVRVTQDPLGHWYASFVVRREVEKLPAAKGSIGIDWGGVTTANTTDPHYDLPHRGPRQRCAAKLSAAQRKMARRRSRKHGPQSAGYARAVRETMKLHKKAARQNLHDARTWAKAVVENHALIAVEDFAPKFLTKSSKPTMERKAAIAAIRSAKRELIDRGERAGRLVVLVRPAYTTMTCSSCFARAKQQPGLDEQTFLCRTAGIPTVGTGTLPE